jgi:hypothetical protein
LVRGSTKQLAVSCHWQLAGGLVVLEYLGSFFRRVLCTTIKFLELVGLRGGVEKDSEDLVFVICFIRSLVLLCYQFICTTLLFYVFPFLCLRCLFNPYVVIYLRVHHHHHHHVPGTLRNNTSFYKEKSVKQLIFYPARTKSYGWLWWG